jgi:hypothetical protein
MKMLLSASLCFSLLLSASLCFGQKLDCGPVEVSSIAPIKYFSSNECVVTLAPDNKYEPPQITATSVGGNQYIAEIDLNDGIYKFQSLEKTVYDLTYIDQCGNTQEIGKFNFFFESSDLLQVSNNFYQFLSDYVVGESKNGTDFLVYLLESNELDYHEKLSFIQRYYYGGKAVFEEEDLSSIYRVSPLREECKCETVSVNYRSDPGSLSANSGTVFAGPTQIETDLNKLEYQLRTAGPAKAWRAYSDGNREQRNRTFGGAVGSNGQGIEIQDVTTTDGLGLFGQNARIRFLLFCNEGVPSPDCTCSKFMRYRTFYESQISVRAETGSGGGTKQSTAQGEDIAISYLITRDGTAEGNMVIQGGFINQQAAACEVEPNDEFWTALVDVAVDVAFLGASSLLNGDTTSNIFDLLTTDLIDDLAENIAAVINEPTTIQTGCGQNLAVGDVRTIEEYIEIYITPNTPTEIGIASRGRLLSTGIGSWQSEAVLSSDYSIAVIQPASDAVSSGDVNCCTQRTRGHYMAKAITPTSITLPPNIDPISTQEDLQIEMAGYMTEWDGFGNQFDFPLTSSGLLTTEFMWGEVVTQSSFPLCSVIGGGEPAPEPGTGDSDGLKSGNPNTYSYAILSINGQHLYDLFIDKNLSPDQLIITIDRSLKERHLPAGIYICRSSNNPDFKARKFLN